MKKVIVAAIVACFGAGSAHAACSDKIDYVPETRAEVATIMETGKRKEHVFIRYALLENLAQQAYEDACVVNGTELPDVAPEVFEGCEDNGVVLRVSHLRKLVKLTARLNVIFCEVARAVVGRDETSPDPNNNAENWAQMCLPIGPEGAMQTETVHIDDVYYWEQNGGTSGSCEGQTQPPQH